MWDETELQLPSPDTGRTLPAAFPTPGAAQTSRKVQGVRLRAVCMHRGAGRMSRTVQCLSGSLSPQSYALVL